MPLYMSTFGYKSEVWAELIKSPEDREEPVREILEQAGCKPKGLSYAFGEDDGFALIEAPDTVSAAAVSIAITSSGALRKFETTVVITQKDFHDQFGVADPDNSAPVLRQRRTKLVHKGRRSWTSLDWRKV